MNVAFVCVHNSCRSQIAEALGKHLASNVFSSYSAGTLLKNQINKDAVRLVKKRYGINMEENQKPKLVLDLPPIDIIITMGCGVPAQHCPVNTGRIGRLPTQAENRMMLLKL